MTPTATPSTVPSRSRRVAAGAGLLVLLLGSGAAVSAMNDPSGQTASCASTADVNVAVADELYPVVFKQASALEKNPTVCADYVVTRASGAAVNKTVKAGGTGIPDVWIPDSSVWVDDATAALGAGWVSNSGSIASSPVVIGVPQAEAQRAELKQAANWAQVITNDKLPVSMQDVTTSSTALSALTAANKASTSPQQRTGLLGSVIRLSRSTLSAQTLASRAVQGSNLARAYPLSEQQLVAFDRSNPSKKLTALVPKEGAPQLDYPFVRPIKATPAPANAVDALLASLRSPQAQAELRADGFRVNGSSAPAGSSVPADVKLIGAPTSVDNVNSVKSWDDLARDARMLVLLDVSGSMSALVSPGQTRADLLASTAKLALNALPGTTQIGAWAFSTNLAGPGRDYLPMVPNVADIGDTPAGKLHKQALGAKLAAMPGLVARNGDTGLYDTIWAAFQAQTKSYREGYVNSIVVLTDGKNDDPNGGLNLKQLLASLGKAYNPKKPIKIVAIAMGQDTDPAALKQIAKATGGLSYLTKNPAEISTVFIDAFLHRS